jgi:hypothetical protein
MLKYKKLYNERNAAYSQKNEIRDLTMPAGFEILWIKEEQILRCMYQGIRKVDRLQSQVGSVHHVHLLF